MVCSTGRQVALTAIPDAGSHCIRLHDNTGCNINVHKNTQLRGQQLVRVARVRNKATSQHMCSSWHAARCYPGNTCRLSLRTDLKIQTWAYSNSCV